MKTFVKSLLAALVLPLGLLGAGAAQGANISGAGATFPYPIYAKWADAYKKQTGVGLNYQSIGSGGGIKQIKAKTVIFGASDMPLPFDQLEAAGLVQFPTVMGGVVPVVNLPGVKSGEITLDGPTLAAIYLGDVARWNDARIAKLNPSVKLPSKAIAVVHRSDGSGTTFIFTTYLSQVSPDWKSNVGASTAVQWPVGLGSKGNEGVANQTSQTSGAIGYVEYAYAKQNKLTWLKLKNSAGHAVAPSAESFEAAAANADWAGTPGFRVILTNEPGAKSWPIAGATFILVPKQPANPAATAAALKFFSWAYDHGDKMAEDLDYVPMPGKVVKLIRGAWQQHIKDASGKVVYR